MREAQAGYPVTMIRLRLRLRRKADGLTLVLPPVPPGRRGRQIPAPALTLHGRFEARDGFLEIGIGLRVTSWSFLTSHARVLLCIARDPGARLRDIAATWTSPNAVVPRLEDADTRPFCSRQSTAGRNRLPPAGPSRVSPQRPRTPEHALITLSNHGSCVASAQVPDLFANSGPGCRGQPGRPARPGGPRHPGTGHA